MENKQILVFEIKDKEGNIKKYWLSKLEFEFYKALRKGNKLEETNKIKQEYGQTSKEI